VEVVRVDELTRADVPAGRPRAEDATEGFDALFAREFPRVARPIHHVLGDRARAEEVTQDAFLELLRHWSKVAAYDRPDLWVRRVAIRKAQRERHRAWRRVELERSASPDGSVEPPTPTPTSEVANPLAGHWVSEPVTRADVRRAARLAGDASDAATMLEGLPALPFRVTLFVDGSRNEMVTRLRHGGQEDLTDQENVEVDGDRVLLTPQLADGGTVHRWSIEGDTLRLTFVSTTEAPSEGAPAEAWQRLLYDSAPLARQGP
jgi:DNA-directed RNA polymerase specialized sigma24 family protein